MAEKNWIPVETIAQEIRANEKNWFVNGLGTGDVKNILRSQYSGRIRRFVVETKFTEEMKKPKKKYSDDFTATIGTVGKYYGVLKKKPLSRQDIISSEDWDKLKLAVEKLLPEIVGLSIKQGFELIRTRVRTNLNQLSGLPERLHFWKVSTAN